MTALYREHRAQALLARAAVLAAERRRVYREDGLVARNTRGRPIGGREEAQSSTEMGSPWHTARAETKRHLFEKLDACGEGHTLELVCRNGACGERFTVELGCGQAFFCPACRLRRANAFRVDFKRKQLGLVGTAQRAGLLSRYRRREVGGRFGERLLTVTVPHTSDEGETFSVSERIKNLRNTWERFNRLFRAALRGKLRGMKSGITLDNSPVGLPLPRSRARALPELDLFDLVSSLRVFEWTPGEDGKGHPHFHAWLFSPYLEVSWLRSLWSRAYADVMRPKVSCPLLVVDVRTSQDLNGGTGIANELVKYITKDWRITEDGVERVEPDVFAELYTVIDGTRTRQSSAGLSHWAVVKHKACPCCAFSTERSGSHWARVFVNHELQEAANARTRVALDFPDVPGSGVAPRTRSGELHERYWSARDAEWRSSVERSVVRKRLGISTKQAQPPVERQGRFPF